ncbi:MAG: GGDEF domain-containing protein [Acidobacteria bacterium]|nr:GGDEF domain-containing protein [Acidobacteriota bacterium]
MDGWNKATLKTLFLPGGLLLALAVLVVQARLLPFAPSVIAFYYLAAFLAGALLAWRFHSSRVLFALVTLLLAHRAVEFFAPGPPGAGRTALQIAAILVPLNFLDFALVRERGVTLAALVPRCGLLFLESVFVAVLCRPEETAPAFLHFAVFPQNWFAWSHIPQPGLILFSACGGILLLRYLMYRKPVESGLLWALAAFFLGLQAGVGAAARVYVGTAALILLTSIIENSYVLAYHDELTALPARRAFQDALLHLEEPYAIAAVDIDHFKSFNDTYGHDTGDQVLRMVATRLARVTGGGQAFRVGGEEFTILFPGKSMRDVVPHLELLRSVIEEASFLVRGGQERRANFSGPERRRATRRKAKTASIRGGRSQSNEELSVTVSIGVAEPSAKAKEIEQVIREADKALYRAKQAGRNQVATAITSRGRGKPAAGRTA